jgi:hypothetical protein
VGNLFDCLNILLMNPGAQLDGSRRVYHQMKGNEVMLQFVKGKKEWAVAALKAIANSFTMADAHAERQVLEELI